LGRLAALAVFFGLGLALDVRAASPPLEAYGRLPAIDQVSLSPSGRYLLSIGDMNGKRYILVRTLAGEVRLAVPADKVKVRRISWVDDDHVLVTISKTGEDFADLGREEYHGTINIDVGAHKSQLLFANDARFLAVGYGVVAAYVIDSKPYAFAWNVPKEAAAIGSRVQARSNGEFERWWPDLWRIDLSTNAIQRIAGGSQDIDNWAVNPDGTVAGYSNYYGASSTWELFRGETPLAERKSARRLVGLDGIGRTPGSLLLLDQSGPTDVWVEIAADGSDSTLWPGQNVTDVLRSPTTGMVIGAVIDDAAFQLFDPARQARIDAAAKPFHGAVTLESMTDSADKVIVHTDGRGDSGTFYLVDVAAHRADIIANDYPAVPADQVGEARRVTYAASDGLALDGVLTLPPGRAPKGLPLVVMPHGGPLGPYDRVGFDWMAQAFASRGYAVFQPNYRGSGGHGAALQNAGYGEFGRKMLSDISDGLAAISRQGIADPRRACIVGFSYGGYAALAGVTLQHGLYKCAVAGSGVSNPAQMLQWEENRNGAKFWRQVMGLGQAGAPRLDEISPIKHAASADAPVLLIHGTDDSVVPIVQSETMRDALKAAGKPVEMVITRGEDHWLSNSETRVATLSAAVAFVQKYNPAD
jgi:dipeptidyl aminopeptidase/acylaminoacyl peptidase